MAYQNFGLENAPDQCISEIFPWIQALGFVFHNTVEKAVDNGVDNSCKCLIDKRLHQIA